MKSFTLILISIMLTGCGEFPEDLDPPPVTKPDPTLSATVSYQGNPGESVAFAPTGKDSEFENSKKIIIPAKIPDDITLDIKNKAEWNSKPIKAMILYKNESRQFPVGIPPGKTDDASATIQLLGLRNLLPDGPGGTSTFIIQIGEGTTQTLLKVLIGTPPIVTAPRMIRIPPQDLTSIPISQTVSVIPTVHFEISNTDSSQWTLVQPYSVEGRLKQTVNRVVYSQDGCTVKKNDDYDDFYPVLTREFLFVRSPIPPSEFLKFLRSDSSSSDSISLKPGEKIQLTLYAVLPRGVHTITFSGRYGEERKRFRVQCNPDSYADFVNYNDVRETYVGFGHVFDGARVYYSDSVYSIKDQGGIVSWPYFPHIGLTKGMP